MGKLIFFTTNFLHFIYNSFYPKNSSSLSTNFRQFSLVLAFVATKKRQTTEVVCRLCWHYLSSRAVSSQVFSAQASLTSVFGMGTGGPSPQSAPTYFLPRKKVSKRKEAFLLLTVFLTVSHIILTFSCSVKTQLGAPIK